MSSATSLKYSKRLAVIGAASAAVLSLGTASAALVTIDANILLRTSIWNFNFVPNGSSYAINSYGPSYPGNVIYCGLMLSGTNQDLQWQDTFLSDGAVVDNTGNYAQSRFFDIPADGVTVNGAYRYTPNFGDGGSDSFFGYVTITGSGDGNFTVNSYTYESTPNAGLIFSAVPEPSAALLAFAGAGLFFRRRRA